MSNWSYMKRLMMLVFPTDWSPMKTCAAQRTAVGDQSLGAPPWVHSRERAVWCAPCGVCRGGTNGCAAVQPWLCTLWLCCQRVHRTAHSGRRQQRVASRCACGARWVLG